MRSNDDGSDGNHDVLEKDAPNIGILVVVNVVKTVGEGDWSLFLVNFGCELVGTDEAKNLFVKALRFVFVFLG